MSFYTTTYSRTYKHQLYIHIQRGSFVCLAVAAGQSYATEVNTNQGSPLYAVAKRDGSPPDLSQILFVNTAIQDIHTNETHISLGNISCSV